MLGTNQLIIQIVQSVLEQFNISKYLVQIYLSENFDDILSNFANIDLVVCIGNHSLQRMILSKSKNITIVSGYEHFDLYIEDTKHIDFINKIINTGLSKENASKFIKEVKSKIITVNTSPTIERIIDIKQTELVNEKTIIYPFNFHLDGSSQNVKIEEDSL